MGRPLPGIEAALLPRRARRVVVDGRRTASRSRSTDPDEEGELALRAGWPSMFRGYLDEEERYRAASSAAGTAPATWPAATPTATSGSSGRADDVIKSAGHLIGPFEVESALIEHPAVAEAGVIGKPDEVAGEVVKAFVAAQPGFEPTSDELRAS
jgi:acetyl-CoA synthetase